MSGVAPVQQAKRLALLDMLRGYALFGVLLANLHAILDYTTPRDMLAGVTWPVDGVLVAIHHWLFDMKFIALFAMLFGYGFGLLLKRIAANGTAVGAFFLRRMGILFALGLLNLCLWWADILHVYALAGLVLLLVHRASDKVVLTCAIVFGFGITWAHSAFAQYVFTAAFAPGMAEAYYPGLMADDIRVMAVANYRIQELFQRSGIMVYVYSHAMGCILFGYWLLRKDLFGRLEEYARRVKVMWWIGLLSLPVPWVLIYAGKAGLWANPWFSHGSFPIFQGAVIGIALFHSTSIILLYRRGLLAPLFNAFGHVGRMSLTNYLAQSILYVVFFYGIGFGLLGKVSYHAIWALCITFFVFQIFLSMWWMKRYHHGPVEWCWRQLSYGRRFPIGRTAENGT